MCITVILMVLTGGQRPIMIVANVVSSDFTGGEEPVRCLGCAQVLPVALDFTLPSSVSGTYDRGQDGKW